MKKERKLKKKKSQKEEDDDGEKINKKEISGKEKIKREKAK